MRTKTSSWFETKFQYEQTQEDGSSKKVTESYVVDALSFSEAEESIIKEMEPFGSGEISVKSINHVPYGEIFFDESGEADKFYKAKLAFITLDEKTEKEKRTSVTYLVQASTLDDAKKNINEVMGDTMIDYIIQSISETKIMDVFEKKEVLIKK